MPRRTKRRYAHELYPHAEEGETRSLAVEVPYLYARAIGFETRGTGREGVGDRINDLVNARHIAFLADAIHQGLSGQDAWKWADERAWDETGEWAWVRATFYGVPVDSIKPYPCGPEPDHHDHLGEPDARGWQAVTRIDGKESDCPDCTDCTDCTEEV